jgi:uncharacterized protein (DUF1015 family)
MPKTSASRLLFVLCTLTASLNPLNLPDLKKQPAHYLDFRPFQGYKPHKNLVHLISCPPYNCLTTDEARVIARDNPLSFLHVSRPEVNYASKVLSYDTVTGPKGRTVLISLISQGFFAQDTLPSFYIYGHTKNTVTQYGIIGEISTENYRSGLIKPHEQTIPEKEEAITTFTDTERAYVDPVLLTYKASPKIDALVHKIIQQKPCLSFISEDDNIGHELWTIQNQEIIASIHNQFAVMSCVYIADGHHRSAAASRISLKRIHDARLKGFNVRGNESFNYFLVAMFPDSQIDLRHYNRIIKDLHGLDEKNFLKCVEKKFDIMSVPLWNDAEPLSPFTYGMYLNKQWYHLKAKPEILKDSTDDAVKSLDISVLSEYIFGRILNINTYTARTQIEYIGGLATIKELQTKCDKNGWQLAFALRPVSTQEFMKIVDTGQLMPAKTTWFEPKLRPGLVVRLID